MITDKDYGSSARYMTLRDYFAAQAMQGIVSDSEGRDNIIETQGKNAFASISAIAYAIADAMIAERNK